MIYKIEKDPYLEKWVVWEVHQYYMIDVFSDKYKRNCIAFKKRMEEGK